MIYPILPRPRLSLLVFCLLVSILFSVGLNTYRGTPGLNDPTSDIFNIDRDGYPHDNTFTNNEILNTERGVQFKDCQDLVLEGKWSLLISARFGAFSMTFVAVSANKLRFLQYTV